MDPKKDEVYAYYDPTTQKLTFTSYLLQSDFRPNQLSNISSFLIQIEMHGMGINNTESLKDFHIND